MLAGSSFPHPTPKQQRASRLPSEGEWEKGARGTELGYSTSDMIYPWGNEWDKLKFCHDDNKGPDDRTYLVGSFPQGASWCGALDMAGNVWEWCADWYGEEYYREAPDRNPTGPRSGIVHVLRGGSWSHVFAHRSADRYYLKPDERLPGWFDWASRYCGFRVVANCR